MSHKIIGRLSVSKAIFFYKLFRVGFSFHNGQGTPFIEI
jgi:hypothetical protein